MAYDETKLTRLGALKALAQRAKTEFAAASALAALETKTTQSLAQKADKAATLAGYGIGDAYTKDQVDGKLSAVYKPAGSIAFSSLPNPAQEVLGSVYSITDGFTTDVRFLEGANKKHPAGTNVVVVKEGSAYKFDVLAGFVDLSPFAKTGEVNAQLAKKVSVEAGKRLITEDEAAKLAGIAAGATATRVEKSAVNGNVKVNGAELTVYTLPADVVKGAVAADSEVTQMLTAVFG